MRAAKIKSLMQMAHAAKKDVNLGYLSQLSDIRYLRRHNFTCGVSDYYWYRLYDHKLCPRSQYRDYAGWRIKEELSRSLNSRQMVTPAWDKLTFTILAMAHGIPTAELKAVFKPSGKLPEFLPNPLTTEEKLRAFLARPDSYPLFAKPSYGQQGFGARLFVALAEDGSLEEASGARMDIDAFLETAVNCPRRDYYRKEAGYLFQHVLTSHPDIRHFTGSANPSGLRIVVLNDDSGPIVHRVVWKIIRPGNYTDNFSEGVTGNLICDIDPLSGEVSDAVDGFWPNASFYREHPVTSFPFHSFRIPMWETVIKRVREASRVFNLMKICHWDIVISENGPVFLELNDIGATEFLQLHGKGLLDSPMRDFVHRHAQLSKGGVLSDSIVALGSRQA